MVAKNRCGTSYYGGQNVYPLREEAARSIAPTWQWGALMSGINTSLKDALSQLGKGSDSPQEALKEARRDTVQGRRGRRLEVTG
ncbi:hypothetical protein [Streptomyces decoyicus]|uniref:hypothetical protein n=1 Tax=Streptomyces decoyicus TaxID=249567 RepID=UPI003654B32C